MHIQVIINYIFGRKKIKFFFSFFYSKSLCIIYIYIRQLTLADLVDAFEIYILHSGDEYIFN